MSEKSSRKKKALSQRLIRNERGGGRWGDDEGMLLREWIQKESTFNERGRGECQRLWLREPSDVMSWEVWKKSWPGGAGGRGDLTQSQHYLTEILLSMQGKRDQSSNRSTIHLVFRSDKIWFNSWIFGFTKNQQGDRFWNLKRNLNSNW